MHRNGDGNGPRAPGASPFIRMIVRIWRVRPAIDAGRVLEVDMAKAQEMLETYPRTFNVEAGVLAAAIEALTECTNTCTQCADACLSEEDVTSMVKCIRLNLDCADVCAATGRVVSRQTEYDAYVTRAQLEACIAACKSCGDECEQHAEHMAHCRVCAESCRRCEQACRELLSAIG